MVVAVGRDGDLAGRPRQGAAGRPGRREEPELINGELALGELVAGGLLAVLEIGLL